MKFSTVTELLTDTIAEVETAVNAKDDKAIKAGIRDMKMLFSKVMSGAKEAIPAVVANPVGTAKKK